MYAAAKARGMDLVTITDHDSIDGCLEFLERHPDADDFFISEEIECRFPDVDLKVHIGAYDISERIHRDIQPLRRNVFEAVAYLQIRRRLLRAESPVLLLQGTAAARATISASRAGCFRRSRCATARCWPRTTSWPRPSSVGGRRRAPAR